MAEYYFHGTDLKGLAEIIKSRMLGHEYYDGVGFYITEEMDDALNHGQYVFMINASVLDKSNFHTDNVNDGILYKSGLNIDLPDVLLKCNIDDRRIMTDIMIFGEAESWDDVIKYKGKFS